MAIFPHPDDETMMAGGTMAKYATDPQVQWTVLTMTRGEYGNELRTDLPPKKLGKLREAEFALAMKRLGVQNTLVGPFVDATLKKNTVKMKNYLAKVLKQENPDLVITFEPSGIYGHPDHIALTKSLLSLQSRFPTTVLLLATIPSKVWKTLELPLHMAENPESIKPLEPTIRVSFWKQGWKKYLATLAYRSQNLNSNGKDPLWAFALLHAVEYYALVPNKRVLAKNP